LPSPQIGTRPMRWWSTPVRCQAATG
jgi:hypothetical protein